MDIRSKFREEILLHESELIMETKIGDMVDRIIEFLKKNVKRIGTKLGNKLDIAKTLIQKLRNAGRDFRAGKLDRKKPTYDEQARKDAVDTVKDLAKLLAFFGMNMTLNYFVPLLGVGAGGLLMFFRKLAPEKIADFLTLAIEKGRETVTEMLGLLEDMGYFHAGDATKDEYKIGI
jgi:hypothetical protein